MSLFSRKLISAIFASSISGGLLAIFMAYLGIRLVELNAAALVIGLIFFSRNFFQIFLRVPFGELAQIIGRKPLITTGTLCYVIAFMLMYVSVSPLIVFFATLSVAVGMALYWPAMFAYIGDISEDDYGKVNGYIFQGSDLGVIAGTFGASFLLRNDIVNLEGLFGYGAVIGLIGTVVIYFTLSEVLDPIERNEVDSILIALMSSFRESINSLKKMTRTIPLGKIYAFQLVISFTEFFFGSFAPLLVVIYLGMTNSQVSDILFISTLAIFLFKPYLGSISDILGFRIPVLVSLTITACSMVFLTFAENIIAVIVIYSVMVASSLTSYLAVNGATSYAAPNSQRGLAMGALGFYVSFGRSASSAVLTPLWTFFEINTGNPGAALRNLFWVTAGIILSFVVVLFFVSRDLDIQRKQDPKTAIKEPLE